MNERMKSREEKKVGNSDKVVKSGREIDKRIKGKKGIKG